MTLLAARWRRRELLIGSSSPGCRVNLSLDKSLYRIRNAVFRKEVTDGTHLASATADAGRRQTLVLLRQNGMIAVPLSGTAFL